MYVILGQNLHGNIVGRIIVVRHLHIIVANSLAKLRQSHDERHPPLALP